MRNLRKKASELGEDVRDMAHLAGKVGRERLDRLTDRTSDTVQQGMDHLHSWERALERSIRKQPLKSLLIAAGVGVLLGAFWRRL